MTDRLARYLNALPASEARAELLRCCGAARWADAMLAARPFADDAAALAAAERVWLTLDRADWLEAFAAHPRIGEGGGGDPRRAATREWSRREQAGTAVADPATLAALAAGNTAYERRFGHVFLICATGRTAADMLAEQRRRLGNEPDEELRVAAREQARITRLRLERLAGP